MTTVKEIGGAQGVTPQEEKVSPPEQWTEPPPLPDLQALPGDPIAAALATIAKFSSDLRDLNQSMKKAADEARVKADLREVAAMREKADAIRSGACFTAGLLAASAAMQGAKFANELNRPRPEATDAALVDAKSEAYGLSAARRLSLHESRTAAVFESNRVDAWSNACGAGADVASKSTEIASGFADAAATEHDADARLAASQAKTHETAAQLYGDEAAQMQELAQKAMDAIRSINESRHAAQMAIVSMRG